MEAERLDSFNLPYYNPTEDELIKIIKKEGSFIVDKLEKFEVNYDPSVDDLNDKEFVFNENQSGRSIADCIRAATEPMLVSHFGKIVIDALFDRYAVNVTQNLAVEKVRIVDMVVSLTKVK